MEYRCGLIMLQSTRHFTTAYVAMPAIRILIRIVRSFLDNLLIRPYMV